MAARPRTGWWDSAGHSFYLMVTMGTGGRTVNRSTATWQYPETMSVLPGEEWHAVNRKWSSLFTMSLPPLLPFLLPEHWTLNPLLTSGLGNIFLCQGPIWIFLIPFTRHTKSKNLKMNYATDLLSFKCHLWQPGRTSPCDSEGPAGWSISLAPHGLPRWQSNCSSVTPLTCRSYLSFCFQSLSNSPLPKK